MTEIPTDYLPYDGEMCHVCDKRRAVKVVIFDGGQMSLCSTCKAKDIYNREDY